MIKAHLIDPATGEALHTIRGWDKYPILITDTHGGLKGTFAAATRTGAGTTAIIAARGNDAITLTDLILTTDKVNGASVTVNITDGANTVTLIAATVTDAPCNIAIPFAGHWESWRACRVDMVTAGNVDATLALGYFRVPQAVSMGFSEWDNLR